MPIPVILDTDIGFDVDDVWALAFMLKCPELDVKLITTNTGDTTYSARLVAKILDAAGRTDIPIGIGIPLEPVGKTHTEWLGNYSLNDYPGIVLTDGIGAITETATMNNEKVSIIGIGPLANIAAALTRDPTLPDNARFIGMHGSIHRGYMGIKKAMKEYNVKIHTAACQKVFQTNWDLAITPLDTCGLVRVTGDNFRKVSESDAPLARAVMENHFGWFQACSDWEFLKSYDPKIESSVLYDTVAVYMAFSEELLEMETHPITITDNAMSIINEQGKKVRCALKWKDQDAFEQLVADRLVS